MTWIWFLAGTIAGFSAGMTITCLIVFSREMDKWEGKDK